MTFKHFLRYVTALVAASLGMAAEANSFGFEQASISTSSNTFNVSFGYDFTEFAMFGGRVNIVYDPDEIQFAGFAAASLPSDAVLLIPPDGILDGLLVEPGLLGPVGVEATNFFTGVNSTSLLGTLSFTILGPGSDNTPCGATLCMSVSPINPFVSLLGTDESQQILGQGITSFQVTQVPLPAALWLLLSGVGVLCGLGRTTT